MCFRFTKTLAGGCPRTPETVFRASQGRPPTWSLPGSLDPDRSDSLRTPRATGPCDLPAPALPT